MAKKSSITSSRERHYWVVSPNVRNDTKDVKVRVERWKEASRLAHAAFMGYTEAALVKSYERWLTKKGRKLMTQEYNERLQCDRYEVKRRNLIEAKASTSRENIRMAVGQLLDYAYLGKNEFGEPNKAILLPKKPHPEIVNWLRHLHISIIWREGESFEDNADGQSS